METKAEEKVVGRVPEQLKYSAAERGVSRSGTRNGQLNTTSSSADLGLTELTRSSTQSIDSYIEKCDGSYAVTQSLLGELITRPKLTEKLLERPPFRFLHDIITEVIKVTGFANGLYSADELDSAKITEKQQKINFLDKAIKLVGTQLNTLIEAKAMKIVAGLEPQVTNRFLQLLAVAAKHSSKSKDSVQIVLGGNDLSTLSKADPKTQVITKPEKKLAQEEKPVVTAEAQSKAHMSTPGIEVKRLARPSTAGRRPPRAKTNTMIAAGQPTTGNDSKPQGIILDGKHEDDEVDVSDPLEESRLAETVKKNTCMIRSDGDDSAAQSKLVQDILTRQAEHANSNQVDKYICISLIIVVDSSLRVMYTYTQMDAKNVEDKESGIRLSRAPVQAATSGYIGSESDITRLRNAIQTLVQHTVPLGGAMEFIQDDVEVMLTEERKWENETRR